MKEDGYYSAIFDAFERPLKTNRGTLKTTLNFLAKTKKLCRERWVGLTLEKSDGDPMAVRPRLNFGHLGNSSSLCYDETRGETPRNGLGLLGDDDDDDDNAEGFRSIGGHTAAVARIERTRRRCKLEGMIKGVSRLLDS